MLVVTHRPTWFSRVAIRIFVFDELILLEIVMYINCSGIGIFLDFLEENKCQGMSAGKDKVDVELYRRK